jgi:uncharacterized protein (TIGR02147 family)
MKTTAASGGSGTGFREYLQEELAKRWADNAQYSLRAFAKALRIDHSTLSQLLRGKRRLSSATICGLAHTMGLSEEVTQRFVVYKERVGDESPSDRHVQQLQAEAVEIISHWYHFAILELTKLDFFRPESRWIARVLDLTVDEVNMAVTRLLHLGLLRMVDQQTWQDTSQNACAQLDHMSAGIGRELVVRINRLVNASRGDDHVLSATTVAVDRKRLPIAASYLAKVCRELAELLRGDDASCDDVFQLDILLYPLTTLHQENDHGSTGDSVSDSRQERGQGG